MLLIPTLDLFSSMNVVNKRFHENPKLVQLLNRYATYNGSNPYKAPGLLTVIPHFEYNVGAFIPEGGMNKITQAIYALAQRQGVEFHFGKQVSEILIEDGNAMGIMVDGTPLKYDKIISNMDVYSTYKKLLPSVKHPERTLRQERSTSAVIFYWGIKKEFPQLDVHNILFSDNYQHEFETMAAGDITNDPTVYINITKKYVHTDAPDGCENWFVMVNAPYNRNQEVFPYVC